MQSRTMDERGRSRVNLIDRRLFLTRLAALGGVAVSASSLNLVMAAEPLQDAGQATGDTSPAAGGRGKVQQVRGEIKEYKDPKTGACVRRLTGDGSSNVHPYFTSWAGQTQSPPTGWVASSSAAWRWRLCRA